MPGSDTPHLRQTVTNPSQTGWNQLTKCGWNIRAKVVRLAVPNITICPDCDCTSLALSPLATPKAEVVTKHL
jgi:hypothetical protein